MRVIPVKQRFIFIVAVLQYFVGSESHAEASKQCFLTSNFPGLKTQAWWVPNSTVVDLKTHQQLSKRLRAASSANRIDSLFPLKGHRLVPGDGDTLTLRQRFPGWSGLTDTASINTLTIYSPKSLVGEGKITVGGTDGPLIFLTHGVPAFRNFCFGYAIGGTISFGARGSSQDLVAREAFERDLGACRT